MNTKALERLLSQSLKQVEIWNSWIRKKRWIQAAVYILLIAILLYVVIGSLAKDWEQLIKLNLKISYPYFAITLGLYGINYILQAIAWHILINGIGSPLPFKQNVYIFASSYLTKFLPSPAWYLASRVYLYGKTGIRKRMALFSTVLESGFALCTGIIFFCVLSIEIHSPTTWLFGVAILSIMIGLFHFKSINLSWFTGDSIPTYLDKRMVVSLFAINLIIWAISGPFFLSLMRTITDSIPITMKEILRVWILSSIISFVGSYLLGGVGILREFSLTLLLSRFFPPPMALTITLFVRLVMVLGGILWSLVFQNFMRIFSLTNKDIKPEQL
jgi:glycosyltransferase 2 family protein